MSDDEKAQRRLLVLKGMSSYDHVRYFSEYMRIALDEIGCRSALIDLGRAIDEGMVQWIRDFKSDAVLAFNSQGVELLGANVLAPGTRFYTWMVDEPYYHPRWDRILRTPQLRTLWSNEESCAHAAAMGLAAPQTLLLAGRVLPRPRPEARDIDLLFVGSAHDPDKMRKAWDQQLGPNVCRLMDALIDEWGRAPSARPIREVFASIADSHGLSDHASLGQAEPIILGEVNRYVRAQSRMQLIRHLAHLPMTLVGDGWPQFVSGPHLRFRCSVPFPICEELVARSKVLLAVQPIHAHGASERFFTAMANEAALVTNDNDWLAEHYQEHNEYRSFSLTEPDGAVAAIEQLLGNESERHALTDAARERTLQNHLWRHRAEAFVRMLE